MVGSFLLQELEGEGRGESLRVGNRESLVRRAARSEKRDVWVNIPLNLVVIPSSKGTSLPLPHRGTSGIL